MINAILDIMDLHENITVIGETDLILDAFVEELTLRETKLDSETVKHMEELEENSDVLILSKIGDLLVVEDLINDKNEYKLVEDKVVLVQEYCLDDLEITETIDAETVIILHECDEDCDCEDIPFRDECECCNCEDICDDRECICSQIEDEYYRGFTDISGDGITIHSGTINISKPITTPEWVMECDEYITSEIAFHSIANGIKILSNTGVSIDDAVYHARDVVQGIVNK